MLLLRLYYFYLGILFVALILIRKKVFLNGINFVNNFINTFSIRFFFDFFVMNKLIYPVLMMVFSPFIYLFKQLLFTGNRLILDIGT